MATPATPAHGRSQALDDLIMGVSPYRPSSIDKPPQQWPA